MREAPGGICKYKILKIKALAEYFSYSTKALWQLSPLLQVHGSNDLVAGEVLQDIGLAARNEIEDQVIAAL